MRINCWVAGVALEETVRDPLDLAGGRRAWFIKHQVGQQLRVRLSQSKRVHFLELDFHPAHEG